MKTLQKELLGFTVPVNGVAETLAELVQLCGSEERVVALANNYVLYHQFYTTLRDKIVEALVKESKIAMEGTTDDKGKVTITEKDLEYVGRIEDELNEKFKEAGQPETGLKEFEGAVVAAANSVTVNYQQPVRGTGTSGAVAKKWLAYYDELVQQNKLDLFVAKHELDLEGLDEEGQKTLVAKKVKELITRAEKAAAKSALGDI